MGALAILLPLKEFLASKAGRYVMIGVAALLALFWFVEHERGVGAAHALAKAEAATQHESTRRIDAEKRVREQSDEHAATVTAMGASYATSIEAMAQASHANDGHQCLSPGTTSRMRAVDPGGRKATR